jgi:uncharacterized membrane protein YhaH (DUF805 family)
MTTARLYFFLDGRINRSTYWKTWFLPWAILSALLQVYASSEAFWSLNVVFTWQRLAVEVKRLHDRDKSAWWLLAGQGPLAVALLWCKLTRVSNTWSSVMLVLATVPAIWLLVELAFRPGTSGNNRFGKDPLA